MLQDRIPTAKLIGWVCFVGFVTWLDRRGLYIMYGASPPWLSQGIYFLLVVVLLLWVRAVLGSNSFSRFHRGVLVFCSIWMMILPLIPWTSEKALLMDAARLRVGMTNVQVQAIMATHQGVHTGDGVRFCADGDWKNDACNGYGTVVDVRMEGAQLIAVDIDAD